MLLISTSFNDVESIGDIEQYLPIEDWGFYQINLNIAPFGLAGALVDSVPEPKCSNRGQKRYLNFYDLRSLA